VKTGCNFTESSKEGYGSKRAVLPMMMMNEDKNGWNMQHALRDKKCIKIVVGEDNNIKIYL
jgi:hypothetical protein